MITQQIPIQEVFAAISLTYPNLQRYEISALQWAYECQVEMNEGEGFQKIGWTWENDNTYKNTWVTVPSDVVEVETVLFNGCEMIEKSDNYKKGLLDDEFYKDGPYLHFKNIPKTIECKVTRIPRNSDGDLLVMEADALAIRYYILWQLHLKDALMASMSKDYQLANAKAQSMYYQYLKERRKARGETNRTSEHKLNMANVHWNNMFQNLRKTW